MPVSDTRYLVTRDERRWTIRSGDRRIAVFEQKEDAVLTAVMRGHDAARQGRSASVLVDDCGRVRMVWREAAVAPPNRARSDAPQTPRALQ